MSPDNLIWIDLEMTGLDTRTDYIIEIATLVTDNRLNILAEGPELAIYQNEAVLDAMDEWNTNQHEKSGLLERVRTSRIDTPEAQRQALAFLRRHVPPGVSPMCGNSICQDRRFLHRCMPELEAYFHYRNLDVSTLKELARRWYPEIKEFNKDSNHRAMNDVHASIEELRYYRDTLFIPCESSPSSGKG